MTQQGRLIMTRTLTTTSSLYASTPAEHKGERRDCAVRALSLAANVPYARAHALLALAGRKAKCGTPWHSLDRACPILGGLRVPTTPEGRLHDGRKPTLAAFIAAHPVGRFKAVRRGHAFAVIDGVVHDWGNTGPRARIIAAWVFPGAQHRPNGVQSPA